MLSSAEITEKLKQNWESIKDKVRTDATITNVAYRTWVDPLVFHDFKDNTVTVVISDDNAVALDYVPSHYLVFFKVAISELLDDMEIDVSFVLNKDIINNEETQNDSDSYDGNNQYSSDLDHDSSNLNSKYRFDTFVVGSNNKFAHSAALAVAESPGTAYNPLFLYGGPGLGKTHLMHSIGHFIIENNRSAKVLYVTSEQFTNEVIESIRSGKTERMAKLRDKYRTVDVLMVDDVQFIIGKDATQEQFFHTFNDLHQAGKQIIISSDKPPKEMETLEERFRSRFEMGLIADIQSPDYETRMAILKKYSDNNANTIKKIDNEVLDYIATNIKSNIRELEGALTKIIAYSKLYNVDITLENAKEALKDIIYPDNTKVITPQLIIDTVCEHYNVKKEDIVSKKRLTEIVTPRQIIMYLCREYTEVSLEEIGKLLGKKDHTTVMNGIDRIKEKKAIDSELSKNLDIISKKINPSL